MLEAAVGSANGALNSLSDDDLSLGVSLGGSSLPRRFVITTVSTVRADPTNLKMFVNYHLNCGIDRMILFFDDPFDECIQMFRRDGRIRCVPCDAEHWSASQMSDRASIEAKQVYNAGLGLNWARQEGADWIVHIDSDELIFAPEGDFRRVLEDTPEDVDAVVLPTLEALPERTYRRHFFEDVHWFRAHNSIIPGARRVACLFLPRRIKFGFFRGHSSGKSAIRVQSPFTGIGIHTPLGPNEARIHRSSDAFILHFDSCTLGEWTTKWQRRHDGTGLALRMLGHRKRQFSDFVAAYESGSGTRLDSAYERQCIASEYERTVLRALGLLRRVDLDSAKFGESLEQLPT